MLANEKRVIVGQAVEASSETTVVGELFDSARCHGELKESSWDAGYHSDEVLALGEALGVELLIPEGRTTSTGCNKQSDKQYPKSYFHYDQSRDTYRCPADELLKPVGRYQGNAENPAYTEYGTPVCVDCTQRNPCSRSKKGRRIKRYAGDTRKEAMRQQFQDESVRQRYQQRAGWVEPVFSQLKEQQRLTRFRRKGLAGVRLEFALHALAYNLGRAVALSSGRIGLIYHLNWLKSIVMASVKVARRFGAVMGQNIRPSMPKQLPA